MRAVHMIQTDNHLNDIEILPYSSAHQEAFKELNLAWIRAHWEPEPADFRILDSPETSIIGKGGYIAIAARGEEVLGTCALIKLDETSFELAKMAVSAAARGHGIGWMLGNAVVNKAREFGATRIYLESNTVLEPAMRLYRRLGFKRIRAQPSPYQRCNVHMELLLE